jgi:hypothetical protein
MAKKKVPPGRKGPQPKVGEMLSEFGKAGLLFLGLVVLPVAAWVGAVLTRDGKPLGVFVDRWFRWLVIGLVVVHFFTGVGGAIREAGWAGPVDFAALVLLAMLFVPMLRRLQRSTSRNES